MDKIYAMQLFLCVAERESFTRAAESLGIPKGTISRQIQALESLLGTRLLYRTTRRVQLTQDGMIYYERARDLLANLDELDGLFQHFLSHSMPVQYQYVQPRHWLRASRQYR